MARLPIPGNDVGKWGEILNNFLRVSLKSDGTLKKAADIEQAKADAIAALASLDDKVDKVVGKSLSSNDFSDSEKSKLNTIAVGAEINAVDSVNTKTGTVVLDADDISDTSTTNKFVTSADLTTLSNTSGTNTGDETGATIKSKLGITTLSGSNTGDQTLAGLGGVPASRTVNGHALSADVTVTKSDVGLGNVDNTSDLNKPVSTATQTALDAKLDDSQLDTDGTLAANSDTKIASQKATKAYVDTNKGDTLPSQTGNAGKYLKTDGSATSWDAVALSAPPVDIQIWEGLVGSNVTDTWTKPTPPAGCTPYTAVRVEMVGGGAGGGSRNFIDNRDLNTSSGQSGNKIDTTFSIDDVPSTVAITVGAATAGVTSPPSGGRSSDANASTFGSLLTTGIAGGGNNDGNNRPGDTIGATGGARGGQGGNTANGGRALPSSPSTKEFYWPNRTLQNAVAGVPADGIDGVSCPDGTIMVGQGGSAGQASTTVGGGNGGNGGKYGGGGGGAGGAPTSTSLRGKGGDGGIGVVRVTTW